MTIEVLYETVLKPFCSDKMYVQYEREMVYNDYPKESRIYAWIMEKKVRDIYVGKDGELVVIAE